MMPSWTRAVKGDMVAPLKRRIKKSGENSRSDLLNFFV
jgi:hypothetical protein